MKFRRMALALLASLALTVSGLATIAPAAYGAVVVAAPAWTAWTPYTVGTRVTHNGVDYECLQSHTSQPGWEPNVVPALWKVVSGGGGPDTSAPSVPGNLRSTGVTSSSVSLAWNASTDNVGVTGYNVYRGSTLVTTVSGTSYTDTGRAAATSYTYTVRARDAAGNLSGTSNTVTARTSEGGNPDPNPARMPGAPYLWMGWGDPPNPATVMNATGVRSFTMAFILSSGGCNPAWDGQRPLTGGADAQAINTIKSAGGSVQISFGGW